MNAVLPANTTGITQLANDIGKVKRIILDRMAARGYEILKEEVSGDGPLKAGVQKPQIDYVTNEITLTVSAIRPASAGDMAVVYNAKGQRKKLVTLRPQPAYDYADVVARGILTASLTPTHAKAFLIPVPTRPTDESYLMLKGKYFIFRKSRKGQLANPFDLRTIEKLEAESPAIAESALGEFV